MKGKKGRKGQWPEHFFDDLVDVILYEEKLKEKLLLTNVKNKENGQHYGKAIELKIELKKIIFKKKEVG